MKIMSPSTISRPYLWGSLRSLFALRLILVDFWGLLISKYYHLSKAISFFTAPKNGIIHYYFLAIAEVFGLLIFAIASTTV